jgi:hypothetical protein
MTDEDALYRLRAMADGWKTGEDAEALRVAASWHEELTAFRNAVEMARGMAKYIRALVVPLRREL